MNDFKKAENIVQLMKELKYLPNSFEVESVELNENNDINIVLTSIGFTNYENVIIPAEVWNMDSYEVYKAWINLMIEAENETDECEYEFNGKTKYIPVNPIEVTALKFNGRNYSEVEEFCEGYSHNTLLAPYVYANNTWKLLGSGDIIVKYPIKGEFSVMTEHQFKEMFIKWKMNF